MLPATCYISFNEVKFTPVKKPNAIKLANCGAKEMANVVSDSHRDDAAD